MNITFEDKPIEVFHNELIRKEAEQVYTSTVCDIRKSAVKHFKFRNSFYRPDKHGKVRHLSREEIFMMTQLELSESTKYELPEIKNDEKRNRLEALWRLVGASVKSGCFQTSEFRTKSDDLKAAMGDTVNWNAKQSYWTQKIYLDLKDLVQMRKIYSEGEGIHRCYYLGEGTKSRKEEKNSEKPLETLINSFYQPEEQERVAPVRVKVTFDIDINVNVNVKTGM